MKITDEDSYQKHKKILLDHWTARFDEAQDEIRRMIKEEFYSGVRGFLLNKIIALAFRFFLADDIKEKALHQFEIYMEAGKEYEGNDEAIIERFFDQYVINDLGYSRCKKDHPKFPELIEKMKASFILRVQGVNKLLNCTGETYDELLKNANPNKEEALESSFRQIRNAEENLEFVRENKMLKISSLIKKPAMRILEKEIELGKRQIQERIDQLYHT